MKFIHFDQMSWPLPEQRDGEVAWLLRYQPQSATKSDLMSAATIIDAYLAMILSKTQKERNYICERLKKEYVTRASI